MISFSTTWWHIKRNFINELWNIFCITKRGWTNKTFFIQHFRCNWRSKKNKLAKALIEKLVDYDFSKNIDKDSTFSQCFWIPVEPFNAKDGGDYAEYYTPNAVSRLMSEILVGTSSPKV